MKYSNKIIICFWFITASFFEMDGQQNKIYSEMTLDELLNIDVVVTASKKPEDFFEAPLSTTIISKEEIVGSGVTSIPEALRLSQGVIVREITPGNYDIHIRGYDEITKNVYLTLPYNTTTLVMIDNRIAYSYFSGGTFWETFPIDINDVERIEVVRGPASALYGSNAVTGVINIITSHSKKVGMNAYVNGSTGTNNAKNTSGSIGYNWNDKTKLTFSGNFTERHRFNTDYFNFNTNSYTALEDVTLFITPIKNITTNEVWTFEKFQNELGILYDEDISLRKIGGNVFFSHSFSELSEVEISLGAQKSQSQKSGFLNMATPLSETESKSFYIDTKLKYKNFSGQFNINSGQDFSNYKFNSYKFTNTDVNIEYFKQYGKLSFRPGIGFKHLSYNSPFTYKEPFNIYTFNSQFKDEPRKSSTFSGYLLSEWKPTQNLRFIGAIRVDKFDINKNYFTSFEIASTYRINKNNLIRFAISRANKSPFFFDSYVNTSMLTGVDYNVEEAGTTTQIPINLQIHGQEDLKYPTITNQEIGWRTRLNTNLSLDLEAFYSSVNNFVNPNVYRVYEMVQHINNLGEPDYLVSLDVTGDAIFENYDLSGHQFGAGFTLSYKFSDKVNAKLHGTFQKTKIDGRTNIEVETTNIEIGNITPESTISTKVTTKLNPTQWTENMTPSFFGGFNVNYKFNNNWNFSTDAYVYADQTFVNYDYYKILDESKEVYDANVQMDIKANIILNAKASYQLTKKTTSFVAFKNILGNHKEYGFADQIKGQMLLGLKWEF